MDDFQLLREYTEGGSEAAFRELVRRHLNLVHSVALRQVGDADLAEEISQAVFILLARKARALSSQVVITGWLFRTTRFVGLHAQRSERRRRQREQEAFEMQQFSEPDQAWQRIAPALDSALEQLNETDRNAILLRFFEEQNHKEVGVALGLSEDAARKRVSRALEKLRGFFGRGGFTMSAAVIASALTVNAGKAAPVGLAANVAGAGLAGAAGSATLPALASEALAALRWMKIKLGAAVAISGVALIATVVALLPRISSPSSSPLSSSVPANPSRAGGVVAVENSNRSVLAARRAVTRTNSAFRLRLVAEDTGEPVVNGRVAIRTVVGKDWVPRFDLATDESGVCEIALPPDLIRLDVGAIAYGWGAKYMTWIPDKDGPLPAEYTLKIERLTNSIGGWVRDPSGKPVAGAEILIQFGGGGDFSARETPRERVGFPGDVPAAISDREGHWFCSLIPTRNAGFNIRARHPKFAMTSVESGSSSDEREKDWQRESFRQLWSGTLVTTLDAALTLAGRVTDIGGAPVVGATVVHLPYAIDPRAVQTDADGIFAFEGLGEEEFWFTVSAPGFAPEFRSVKVVKDLERVDIQLKPGAVLRLHLVDENGADVSDAEVGLEEWGAIRHGLEWRAQSDAEGRIEWNSAPPRDMLELCAVKSGWCYTRNVQLSADGKEHTIQMRRAGVVTGQVTDANTGAPIEQFKVIPGYGEGNSEAVWYRGDSREGTNGTFRMNFTEDRSPWRVRLEAPGYLAADSRPIPQSFTGRLEIAMQRATADKNISGVIQLPDGSPAAGAEVALCTFEQAIGVTLGDGRFKPSRTSIGRRADAEGRFSFVPVPEAHSVIVVHAAGFARVRLGQPLQSMRIRLQPWGRVEGTVSGDPEEGMKVVLTDWAAAQYEGGMEIDSAAFSAAIDAEGHFTLEKVPPGNFFVSRKRDLGGRSVSHTPVKIPPGETARIQIGGSGVEVSGKFSAGEVEGVTDWSRQALTASLLSRRTEPLPRPEGLSPEAMKRWELDFWWSDAGHARLARSQNRELSVAADGSFRGYDVSPGTYSLLLRINGRNDLAIGELHESVVIPEKSGSTGDILDLGTRVLRAPRR